MLGALAVVAFIALNGFFVAAEFALVKLRAVRSTKIRPVNDAIGKAVERIDRYLSVTQLGITLASLGLGWLGEPVLGHGLLRAGELLLGQPPGKAVASVLLAIAFGVLTFGHVLLGELVPKLIAIQRSEAIARASLLPLQIIFVVLRPLLWLLESSSRVILRRFGLSLDAHSEAALSEDEILGILAAQVAREPGAADTSDLLRRMVRFRGRTARQAMIPRVDVFYLPIHSPWPRALEQLRTAQYSRVPLSKGDELDQVVGYLYWKDVALRSPVEEETLEALRRDVLFVAESQGLVHVLREMQKVQVPFAVVVDEYGGASGILTMEDLLEEIVGEIRDELDRETMRVERREDGWHVDGSVMLDELVVLGLEAQGLDRYTTLSGAITARLGRLPRAQDQVMFGDLTAEVTGLSRRRITRVHIRPGTPPRSDSPPSTGKELSGSTLPHKQCVPALVRYSVARMSTRCRRRSARALPREWRQSSHRRR